MNILVKRFLFNEEVTIGKLYINNVFMCYTLEDKTRKIKIYGKTAIPAKSYNLELQTVGSKHTKYSLKFPKTHKGMLHIKDVPNYEGVMIHIGNNQFDTLGCILVGLSYDEKLNVIYESTKAYLKIYPIISEAIEKKEKVTINITEER